MCVTFVLGWLFFTAPICFFFCCECVLFSLNAGRKDDALTVIEGLRSKGMEVMDLSSNELAKASASAVLCSRVYKMCACVVHGCFGVCTV